MSVSPASTRGGVLKSLKTKEWACPNCGHNEKTNNHMCESCRKESPELHFVSAGGDLKNANRWDKFRATFKKDRVVLPVIHVKTPEQTSANIQTAIDAGCDGVFLLNHDLQQGLFREVVRTMRDQFPELWMGIGLPSFKAYDIWDNMDMKDINGLFTEDAFIREVSPHQNMAEVFLHTVATHNWKGLYFGGISTTQKTLARDLPLQVKLAQPYIDVITSSGYAIGCSIDHTKLETIAKANEKKNPIAICSGIALDNVKQMLPYCNAYMVNSHFATNEIFDKQKLQELVQIVKAG